MQQKGQGLPIRTVAIVLFALIVAFAAVMIMLKSQGAIRIFGKKFGGVEMSVSGFVRRCKLACKAADGKFDPSKSEKFDYCNITLDTSDKGGKEKDHCWGDTGGIIKVNCTLTNKKGNTCKLTNGCGC